MTQAKESKPKEDKPDDIIRGEPKDVVEQTKTARKEKGVDVAKLQRDYSDGRDKQAEKILEEAHPERKAVDLRIASREEFLEKAGEVPGTKGSGHPGMFKVEKSDVKHKMYIGQVTGHSVHRQTLEKLSYPIVLSSPSGEEYVWHCFQTYHPDALREEFEIDDKNETDPNLRSKYG